MGRPAPNTAKFCSKVGRSVKSTQRAAASSDSSALSVTSSPIPAGSPAEIPIVARIGKTGGLFVVFVFVFLVHVLNVMLQNEDIGIWSAVQFNGVFVIPFNRAFDDFPILENDDHGG